MVRFFLAKKTAKLANEQDNKKLIGSVLRTKVDLRLRLARQGPRRSRFRFKEWTAPQDQREYYSRSFRSCPRLPKLTDVRPVHCIGSLRYFASD